jgi:hypothetical protein
MTTKRESKRILSVTVKQEIDDLPDTSFLGEYSDTPGDCAIVARGEHEGEFVSDLPCECDHSPDDHNNNVNCMENCDCEDFDQVSIERGREYRYFNPPADNYEGESDENIRKYCQHDYDRMRGLNNDQWCFTGISAKAVVQLNGDLTQTIHSGGLWGIESDSDASYISQIADEQLSELRDQLLAIGFSKRAVAAAFRNVERKEL